eukprot:647465-Rhodomonas_salina.1
MLPAASGSDVDTSKGRVWPGMLKPEEEGRWGLALQNQLGLGLALRRRLDLLGVRNAWSLGPPSSLRHLFFAGGAELDPLLSVQQLGQCASHLQQRLAIGLAKRLELR